jgi:3-hydroxyacyl-[acyl-carrier-protein] dehydratase
MLKDSLYKLSALNLQPGIIEAELDLDPACVIFNGHFPGQPILPGACILQMLKEVLENGTGLVIFLKKSTSIKFMAMVDPALSKSLKLTISYSKVDEEIKVSANMFWKDTVCFKFQGVFSV